MPQPTMAVESRAPATAALDGEVLDPQEALDALLADSARITSEEDLPSQRLTINLIAERSLDRSARRACSAEDLAEQLMCLTRLRLDRLRLNSLDGLELCNGVTHLHLQHNRLRDLEGLDFLNQLGYLMISHNRLSQLSGLSHLPSLQYVDASHNAIAECDGSALPPGLMALELHANPCVDPADYRERLVRGLPKLLYLDEVRISSRERNAACGITGGDDESDEEGEEEEGEEEEEEEEEEEDDEAEDGEGAAVGGGEAAEEEVAVGSYLSSAKARVAAQLAQVDALLEQSGYHEGSPVRRPVPVPPSPTRGSAAAAKDASARDGTAALDPTELYGRALDAYGINADVQVTQEKLRAIRERTAERRREFNARLAEAEAEAQA